jgi:hypothetical protein
MDTFSLATVEGDNPNVNEYVSCKIYEFQILALNGLR